MQHRRGHPSESSCARHSRQRNHEGPDRRKPGSRFRNHGVTVADGEGSRSMHLSWPTSIGIAGQAPLLSGIVPRLAFRRANLLANGAGRAER